MLRSTSEPACMARGPYGKMPKKNCIRSDTSRTAKAFSAPPPHTQQLQLHHAVILEAVKYYVLPFFDDAVCWSLRDRGTTRSEGTRLRRSRNTDNIVLLDFGTHIIPSFRGMRITTTKLTNVGISIFERNSKSARDHYLPWWVMILLVVLHTTISCSIQV